MRARLRLALPIVLALSPCAQAQEDLSPGQWRAVVGFIDQMLSTAKSGSDNPYDLDRSLAINVVPHKAISRSTGEICGAGCYDPCRGFNLSVTRQNGRLIQDYSGRRCSTSADFSAWSPDGPIALDRVLRSGPDPDLVQRAASYLVQLAYLPDASGTPDPDQTMEALRAFRGDSGTLPVAGEDITPDDIEALRATVDRSSRSGTCAVPPTARYSACETSAF